jgi:hypothetical protein
MEVIEACGGGYPPAIRRLRVYAFDPAASTDLRTATMYGAVVKVPWEDLAPGPVGEYMEVSILRDRRPQLPELLA